MIPLLVACTAPGVDGPGVAPPPDAETGVEAGDSGAPAEPGGWSFLPTAPTLWTWPTWKTRGIVYLNVDTLRYDHLPASGYARETTPNLSAEPWIQLDGIDASASWTVPSTASLLTGTPPWVHGMTDVEDAGSDYIESRVPSVAAHLADLGWATSVFTGNEWVGSSSDLVDGFDTVVFLHKSNQQYNLIETLDPALDWLDALPVDQPFYLHLQPMDMHSAYWVAPEDLGHWGEPPPPFDVQTGDQDQQNTEIALALRADEARATQALLDVYDEQLLGLDRGFGQLREALQARGLWDDVLFVVSADHGETLNDDGEGNVGHARWLREELVRVPVLLRPPDGVGAVVSCLAPNERLFPTILDRLGLPPLPTATARPLGEGCDGQAVSTIWASATTVETLSVTDGQERLDRYCLEGREVGWDLRADPRQQLALEGGALVGHAALAAELDATLDEIRAVWPDGNTCAIPPAPARGSRP